MSTEKPTNLLARAENAISELLEKHYPNHPIIRILVQALIPGLGSILDTALAVSIERLKHERVREFFDELVNQDITLTEEQIQNEDFLHAYFATAKAALNTRRREKIRLFARLLANYTHSMKPEATDTYEEMLAVLDDLSFREFQVLLVLHRFETRTPISRELETQLSRTQRASEFWDAFCESVVSEIGIPTPEIPGILTRLTRTGLYQPFLANIPGYTGDKGGLTPNFFTLQEALGKTDRLH